MNTFFVIEANKGKGPEGQYLSIEPNDLCTNGYGSEKRKITSNIENTFQFCNKKSATTYYREQGFSMKHWLVTEHSY